MTKYNTKKLEDKIFSLIVNTSSTLPKDVFKALETAYKNEYKKSIAALQLKLMLENAKIAKKKKLPICQDTGTLSFIIESANFATAKNIIEPAIITATQKATSEAFLRVNTISSLTGKPCTNNISENFPEIEIKINPVLKRNSVSLLMKGGGSENIGSQYSLPDENLNAERDINGVKKVIIDSVINAQGKACPPGAVAVCVGGDRASGYSHAKKLFFRKIGERSKIPEIASLEIEMLKRINSLGIGPQGLGGKTFALELFITFLSRHPASFFVTISHMCWAWRRGKIIFD